MRSRSKRAVAGADVVPAACVSESRGIDQVDQRLVYANGLFRDPVQNIQEVLLSEDGVLAGGEAAAAQRGNLLRAEADQRLEFDMVSRNVLA
jgi:hypothetical protein